MDTQETARSASVIFFCCARVFPTGVLHLGSISFVWLHFQVVITG